MATLETKVPTAAGGATLGAAVAIFLDWLLGVTVWNIPNDGSHVQQAIDAVPAPVAAIIPLVLAYVGAFIAGYLAPHTHRPDIPGPVA